jgi:cytochrome oxidase assembly protein ShyY1
MTNPKSNFNGFTDHTGLFRVWRPVVEGGRTVLVARWIPGEAKASNEREAEASSSERKARRRCSGTNLRAA